MVISLLGYADCYFSACFFFYNNFLSKNNKELSLFVIFHCFLAAYISAESVTKCCDCLQYSKVLVKFCALPYAELAPS
tara:strand:- start:2797 stop:3030 length:234 start_codon:yes stop_codon:yes gene_type:complete